MTRTLRRLVVATTLLSYLCVSTACATRQIIPLASSSENKDSADAKTRSVLGYVSGDQRVECSCQLRTVGADCLVFTKHSGAGSRIVRAGTRLARADVDSLIVADPDPAQTLGLVVGVVLGTIGLAVGICALTDCIKWGENRR
jgi:hypothetical protein